MSTPPPFRIERLASHDRKAFSCGEDSLDTWFVELAGQQQDRGLTAVWVMVEESSGVVVGFYSLSNYAVLGSDLPKLGGKKLPARMQIPMHLLGKLGVHKAYQQRGIGQMLVNHALHSAKAQTAVSASLGVVVHALTEELALWYRALGFVAFPEHPLQLVMTMSAIAALP